VDSASSGIGPGRNVSRRGVVLLAALVLVAILAVLVTAQVERLPFVSAEGRSAMEIAQGRLDVDSALQLAVAILRADAGLGQSDSFGDLWARPHEAQVGDAGIVLTIGDYPFFRVPEDEWLMHDYGIPKGVALVASRDPYVRRLFENVRPNVNTAPMPVLAASMAAPNEAMVWLRGQRLRRVFARPDDFEEAPGYRDRFRDVAGKVAFRSPLFLAEAGIRRAGQDEERHQWILAREGDEVAVLYSAEVEETE